MLKRWSQFTNENISEDDSYDEITSETESEDKKNIREAILEILEKSLSTSDETLLVDFIDSYLKDPEVTNIEGLINDSDVWDFYTKWTNEVDDILDEIKYFDEVPSENNIYGVYDFVVKSSRRAIKEVITEIKKEMSGN